MMAFGRGRWAVSQKPKLRMFDEMKNFPFYFFLFYAIDVSPTGDLDCEISAQKCQPPLETKTRTVTPKDSVTFNCSIKNGGKVQDMTWKDLERNLSANNGLFIHQNNSKDKNLSRECFSIKYASKYVLLNYSELLFLSYF